MCVVGLISVISSKHQVKQCLIPDFKMTGETVVNARTSAGLKTKVLGTLCGEYKFNIINYYLLFLLILIILGAFV